MEHLLKEMMESAKKDKNILNAMKNLAVNAQQFELSASLRKLEEEFFPESEEAVSAKQKAEQLRVVFRLVDLSIPNDVCWVINETLKLHSKLKGNFSVKHAAELIAKRKNYFGTE